ncbi:hypothetical protein DYB25_009262 [Aphanomyces astaci]|uniref:Protein kinase domain-containing protein n=1 Tax=Aphanomyces astaci TaxID=112090 RepID=A0A396ZMC3_APHAT|nr:hypothetical protein DYB25_009262 [Aphanomyces astaci]RHY68858.1 hypothetical protein DYB30_007598 [Aphanomyces astaci]
MTSNGVSIQRSTRTKVKMEAGCDIARFSVAVRANHGFLKGSLPSKLCVHTNQAAYDAKSRPLGPNVEIGAEVGVEDDELVVVVPGNAPKAAEYCGDVVPPLADSPSKQAEDARRKPEGYPVEQVDQELDTMRRQVERIEIKEGDGVSRQLEGAFEALRRDLNRQTQLLEAVLSKMTTTTSSKTDGLLGQEVHARLKSNGLFIKAAQQCDQDAFWTLNDQVHANQLKEAALHAMVATFFEGMLGALGMVYVNCEQHKWLPQASSGSPTTYLKPDGFATHAAMYRRATTGRMHASSGHTVRIGVPEVGLFDCLIVFECKRVVGDAALGQVARYMENLSTSTGAILFGRESCWLIESHCGIIVKVVTVHWVEEGSKALIREFLANLVSPWVARLTDACAALDVTVEEGCGSYLGRGAHGRVFKVENRHRETFAMEVVEKRFSGHLYREQFALEHMHVPGVTIDRVEACTEFATGAAMLTTPVGSPHPRPNTRHDVHGLFCVLKELHDRSLVHGDPRVSNVIVVEESGELRWIDLSAVRPSNSHRLSLDVEILARSILQVSWEHDMDLNSVFDEYGQSPTQDNMNFVAELVWGKMHSTR